MTKNVMQFDFTTFNIAYMCYSLMAMLIHCICFLSCCSILMFVSLTLRKIGLLNE